MIESGRRRGELILTTASGAIKGTGDVPVITPVLFGMSAAIEFLFFIGLMSQQARHLTGRKARHGISTDSGVTLQNLSGFRVQNGAEAPRDTPDSQDAYATLLAPKSSIGFQPVSQRRGTRPTGRMPMLPC